MHAENRNMISALNVLNISSVSFISIIFAGATIRNDGYGNNE